MLCDVVVDDYDDGVGGDADNDAKPARQARDTDEQGAGLRQRRESTVLTPSTVRLEVAAAGNSGSKAVSGTPEHSTALPLFGETTAAIGSVS